MGFSYPHLGDSKNCTVYNDYHYITIGKSGVILETQFSLNEHPSAIQQYGFKDITLFKISLNDSWEGPILLALKSAFVGVGA